MLNKVMLIGYLGKDPEVRSTQGGQTVANFSIATSRKWKDKAGNKQEKTEWHSIVVWGKLAEICGQYLEKGKLVYLEGEIQTRTWEKDGETKWKTEINVHHMQMLGGGGGKGESSKRSDPPPRTRHQEPDPDPGTANDDDIPF